jgi:hypothetical protein
VNLVQFDAAFAGANGGEGLLTVDSNTNRIGLVDERFAATNLPTHRVPLPSLSEHCRHAAEKGAWGVDFNAEGLAQSQQIPISGHDEFSPPQPARRRRRTPLSCAAFLPVTDFFLQGRNPFVERLAGVFNQSASTGFRQETHVLRNAFLAAPTQEITDVLVEVGSSQGRI